MNKPIFIFICSHLIFFCLNPSLLAKPHKHAPNEESQEEIQEISPEEITESGFVITTPPKAKRSQRYSSVDYIASQDISVRLGTFTDIKNPDNSGKALVGFSYLVDKIRSPRWEVGADMVSNSSGILFLFRKHTYRERQFLRFHYKYGVSHTLVARESLASIVNYKNYQATAGAGLAYTFLNPMSIKLEVEAHAGIEFIFANMFLGLSFGW